MSLYITIYKLSVISARIKCGKKEKKTKKKGLFALEETGRGVEY